MTERRSRTPQAVESRPAQIGTSAPRSSRTVDAASAPLLETIDEALGRGDSAPEARAELAERLQQHLEHEEEAALPLVDATLSLDQWMQFGQIATERVGPNMPNFLPLLLDGADKATTARALAFIPEPVQQTYRNE